MMARLKEWAAKVDAMAVRERALVFIACAISLVVLAHTLALQPLLRQHRTHLDRMRADEGQLKSLHEALLKRAQGDKDDPLAARRASASELEQRLAAAERMLEARRSAQATPEQLTTLLRDILGRSRNVRLVALRLLPAVPLASPKPAAGGVPKKPAAADPRPQAQFYRHAVEIDATGPYLELLQYLQEVEALPWKPTWTGIELKTAKYPQVSLRATLHTVSPSESLIRL